MKSMTLQQVIDRIEIDDLLTRYATAIDTQDWHLYAGCFTPDAFIDYTTAGGIKGHLAEVKAWIAQVIPICPMTQHVVCNRAITLNGDTAIARSCFFNPMALPDADGGRVLFFDRGYYNDTLVGTPDGWRIAQRIEETSYSTRADRIAEEGELGL